MDSGKEDDRLTVERRRMVRCDLRGRDITDPGVLKVMGGIHREDFMLASYRSKAYVDGPVPIGMGQTISQPYIVALMTQMLKLRGDENVLEVGTGSGYQAAVLAYLVREVHTIERHTELAEHAIQVLNNLNISNVHVHISDGSLGLPESAPYQAILVTAAAPKVPQSLLAQLDDGGRLVLPVGGRLGQYLERWERHGSEHTSETMVPVAFVPLRGRYGWQEGEWDIY